MMLLESIKIVNTPLSLRVRNSLQREGIMTVGDLIRSVQTKFIDAVRNFGDKGLEEVGAYFDSLKLEGIIFGTSGNEPTTDHPQTLLESIRDFSIALWAPYLTTAQYEKLLRSNHKTADEVVLESLIESEKNSSVTPATKKKIQAIFDEYSKKNPTDFLQSVLSRHQLLISNKIKKKVLHPKLRFGGKEIVLYTQIEYQPYEFASILQSLCRINYYPNISFELERIMNLKKRDLRIVILRLGFAPHTLEEVGDIVGVTRERIRQIEKKSVRQIWNKYEYEPNVLLKSAIKYAKDLEKAFSLEIWTNDLSKKRILGKISPKHQLKQIGVSVDEALYALLNSSRKDSLGKKKLSDDILIGLDYPYLTVQSVELLQVVPKKDKRTVKRKIAYTCGLSIQEAQEILQLSEEEALFYLDANDLFNFGNGWYTFSDPSQFSRSPIQTAGLKLVEACPPLSEQEFSRGLRKYISRHFSALAPRELVRYMLELYGFEIVDGKVLYPKKFKSRLNDSERLFLQLLDQHDGVLSFYEVVTLFIGNGFSVQGATIGLLSHSTLPVKVDKSPDRFTYYTLRGRHITWNQLKYASERQLVVSANSSFKYQADGCIIFETTLNTWAVLSGVLAVHSLPNLSGDWPLLVNGDDCGTGSMDESFMWGLNSVMEGMGAKVGDRVEIVFNTWERTTTFRKKIE